MELRDKDSICLAALSKAASDVWLPCLDRIVSIRVVAMIRREQRDAGDEYRALCRCDSWEIP